MHEQKLPFVGETFFAFLSAEYNISIDGITMGSFLKAPVSSTVAFDFTWKKREIAYNLNVKNTPVD